MTGAGAPGATSWENLQLSNWQIPFINAAQTLVPLGDRGDDERLDPRGLYCRPPGECLLPFGEYLDPLGEVRVPRGDHIVRPPWEYRVPLGVRHRRLLVRVFTRPRNLDGDRLLRGAGAAAPSVSPIVESSSDIPSRCAGMATPTLSRPTDECFHMFS